MRKLPTERAKRSAGIRGFVFYSRGLSGLRPNQPVIPSVAGVVDRRRLIRAIPARARREAPRVRSPAAVRLDDVRLAVAVHVGREELLLGGARIVDIGRRIAARPAAARRDAERNRMPLTINLNDVGARIGVELTRQEALLRRARVVEGRAVVAA